MPPTCRVTLGTLLDFFKPNCPRGVSVQLGLGDLWGSFQPSNLENLLVHFSLIVIQLWALPNRIGC